MSLQPRTPQTLVHRLQAVAFASGCLAVALVGCSGDDRPKPSAAAGGTTSSAGRDGKAGQAGKASSSAGDGNVAAAGTSAEAGGQGNAEAGAPAAGNPASEGPPGVGGDPGLMLEPCPSDDAAAPASFAGVCTTAQAWTAGEVALETLTAPTLVAATPDELTLLWSEADSSVPTYFVADRESAAGAFDEAQELAFSGVAGISPDGLRLTLAHAGRLTEAVRSERGEAFGEPAPGAYADLDANAETNHLALTDVAISPDDHTLFYSVRSLDQYTEYPLLVSQRSGSEPWPVGVALKSCELKAYGARGLRPSAVSNDGLTLFYFDGARATTRAAFRTSPSADFSWFKSLPGVLQPQPNASCDKLYFSPTTGVPRLLVAERKP